MIVSPQNERVKYTKQLQTQAKIRTKDNRMILEGVRLVRDALLAGFPPDFIFYDPELLTPEAFGAQEALAVTPEIIKLVSSTEQPQGVVGVFPIPELQVTSPLTQALILDNIRDPGNLGTILRTAGAAGVQIVLLSPGCVDAYNPKVVRAGMGAHLRLPIVEASWTRIAVYCQSLKIYLADMVADFAYDEVAWQEPYALIIGSEAHGASPEAETLAHHTVSIPMANATESLNAAISTGIFLFEAGRQRKKNS